MPTVLKIKGYRFFFFSREELRQHIHIQCQKGEAKFWLDPEIELAKNYMKQRVEFYAIKMGLIYNEIKFRRMKRRWGSCSSKKDITLNLYLYNTSKELIDYVIVHELAHLVQMNHSKKFHKIVMFYMPNSKELEKNLKKSIFKKNFFIILSPYKLLRCLKAPKISTFIFCG